MGSTVLIDILGSLIIGGLLLLTALQMNDNATANTFQSQENLTVQQNMTSVVENIESDFRRIGYCKNPLLVTDKTKYILYGRSDSIAFTGDIGNDGTLDTVRWWIGDYVKGPNPRIRMLCRRVDETPTDSANMGITQFSMMFIGWMNDTIATYVSGGADYPALVQLTLRVEPTAAYDTAYYQNFSYWRQTRLVSRNIKLNF